jgi:hypothetical protein
MPTQVDRGDNVPDRQLPPTCVVNIWLTGMACPLDSGSKRVAGLAGIIARSKPVMRPEGQNCLLIVRVATRATKRSTPSTAVVRCAAGILMLQFLVLLVPPVTLVVLVWMKEVQQRRHPLHPERLRTRSKPTNSTTVVRRLG